MSEQILKPEARVIVKYELTVSEMFRLELQKGAEVLSVMVDNNTPKLYVLVDPEITYTISRFFEIVPTGHTLRAGLHPDGRLIARKFIGSFQINNGNYIGHVFERLN